MNSEVGVQVVAISHFTFLKLRIPFTENSQIHKPLNQIPWDFKTRRSPNSEFSDQLAHFCVWGVSVSKLPCAQHFPHIKNWNNNTKPSLISQKSGKTGNYKLFKCSSSFNPFQISPKPCYRNENPRRQIHRPHRGNRRGRKVNETNEAAIWYSVDAAER